MNDFECPPFGLKVETIIRPLDLDLYQPDKLQITNVKLDKSFIVSTLGLYDDRELPKLLSILKVPVIRKERGKVQDYLMTQYTHLFNDKHIKYEHTHLGWFNHEGADLYLLQHNEINGNVSDCIRKDFHFQNGNAETYISFLDETVYKNPNLSLAVIIGFTAVVASKLKNKLDTGAIICNISGVTSTGKSTAAKLIASLFAAPNKYGLVYTFNASNTAMPARLIGINGLPMIIDDILANEKLDISQLIYSFAEGSNKDRCDTNGRIKNDSNDSFSGVIVLTSEYPILDCGNHNQGLIVRTLAMNDISWTPDSNTADLINQTISDNYGWVGATFANYIQAIPLKTLYKDFLKAKKKLHKIMPNFGGFTDRLEKQYAVIYLTISLVNKCFNKKLNANKLIQIALNSQQTSIEENNNADIALEAVKSYIVRYHTYFEFKPANDSVRRRGFEYFGTIVDKSPNAKEVYILPDIVDKIISQNSIRDKRGVKREWRDTGLIKTEKGRFTCKYSGSPIKNKRYFCFQFNDIALPFELVSRTAKTSTENIDWGDGNTIEEVFGDTNE